MANPTPWLLLGFLAGNLGSASAQIPAAPRPIDPVNSPIFNDVRIIQGALRAATLGNAVFFNMTNAPPPLSYCVGFANQVGALDQGLRMVRQFVTPLRTSGTTRDTALQAAIAKLDHAHRTALGVFTDYCASSSAHFQSPALVNRTRPDNGIDRLNHVYEEAQATLTFAPLALGTLDAAFYNRFILSLLPAKQSLLSAGGMQDRCLAISKAVGATDSLLNALPPPFHPVYGLARSPTLAFRATYFGINYADNDPLVARIAGVLGIQRISTAGEGSGFLPWTPHTNCTRTADIPREDDIDEALTYLQSQFTMIESGRLE